MIKPNWLIETNVQGRPSEALQAEIRWQDMVVQVVKLFLYTAKPGETLHAVPLAGNAVVFCSGALPSMQYIQSHRRLKPGDGASSKISLVQLTTRVLVRRC